MSDVVFRRSNKRSDSLRESACSEFPLEGLLKFSFFSKSPAKENFGATLLTHCGRPGASPGSLGAWRSSESKLGVANLLLSGPPQNLDRRQQSIAVNFHDDQNRIPYLERLKLYRERYGFRLLAYVLMSNHVHRLIETKSVPLSKMLQESSAARLHRDPSKISRLYS